MEEGDDRPVTMPSRPAAAAARRRGEGPPGHIAARRGRDRRRRRRPIDRTHDAAGTFHRLLYRLLDRRLEAPSPFLHGLEEVHALLRGPRDVGRIKKLLVVGPGDRGVGPCSASIVLALPLDDVQDLISEPCPDAISGDILPKRRKLVLVDQYTMKVQLS